MFSHPFSKDNEVIGVHGHDEPVPATWVEAVMREHGLENVKVWHDDVCTYWYVERDSVSLSRYTLLRLQELSCNGWMDAEGRYIGIISPDDDDRTPYA